MREHLGDITRAIVDNKEETMVSCRGVLKLLIFSFIKEPIAGKGVVPFTKEVCKVLALRGYGKPAKVIFKEISSMNADQAQEWIEEIIWDKHITTNDILNLINFGRII